MIDSHVAQVGAGLEGGRRRGSREPRFFSVSAVERQLPAGTIHLNDTGTMARGSDIQRRAA
jgi:hypothetical protein